MVNRLSISFRLSPGLLTVEGMGFIPERLMTMMICVIIVFFGLYGIWSVVWRMKMRMKVRASHCGTAVSDSLV